MTQIKENPDWITIKVPYIAEAIKTPRKISQLVYQLNMRGFNTSEIRWGDPIEIELKSHIQFINRLVDQRRCGKKEIYTFNNYLVDEIDFKLNVHPFISGNYEPVILTLLLKHSQISKFQKLFYNAFIRNHD